MAKIVIKYEGFEATAEDEQSAAKLMLALRGNGAVVRPATPSVKPVRIPVPKANLLKPPAPPSPLQDAVKKALTSEPQTTAQLIERMERNGYKFTAKHKRIAVNSALADLKKKGEAKVHGLVTGTNKQLWAKGGE